MQSKLKCPQIQNFVTKDMYNKTYKQIEVGSHGNRGGGILETVSRRNLIIMVLRFLCFQIHKLCDYE
jgi:hypothetical protein